MMRVRRMGVGVLAAAVTLTAWLVAGGCGFGGSNTDLAQGAPAVVAQMIVLRDDRSAQPRLETLLTQNGPNFPLAPGQWGFPSGGSREGDPEDVGAPEAQARAVNSAAEQAGIDLSASKQLRYAHWLVPGFDTTFYLAQAPADAKPRPNGTATVDAGWFEPQRALSMHRAGKMAMGYPTIKQLESLVRFPSADDALDAARRSEPRPVELRIVGQGDQARAVLPEDVP